jgi:hypothetical protein
MINLLLSKVVKVTGFADTYIFMLYPPFASKLNRRSL